MATARLVSGNTDIRDHLALAAIERGDLVKTADDKVGVACADIANGAVGSVMVNGVFDIDSASATTVADGGEVYADISDSNKIIPTASKATGDILAGVAITAKVNGDLTARIDLNVTRGTISA